MQLQNHKIIFISGVSGVGKTSVKDHLKSLLSPELVDVRDLDERGVPDGGGIAWLLSETRHWLDVAKTNAQEDKDTIICGFANPELFEQVYNKENDIPAEIILLDASSGVIEQQLRGRHTTHESLREIERAAGKPFDEFVAGCVSFAPTLRAIFEKHSYPIIDTDNKTPSEVAQKIIVWLVR